MVKRIILFGILGSLLQVFLYYGIIILLWKIGKLFHTPSKTDFTFHFTILFSIYYLLVITIFQNCLVEIFNTKKTSALLYFISLSTFLFVWIDDLNTWPIRTFLFIIAGITSLSLKFYIDTRLDKSKIVNLKS